VDNLATPAWWCAAERLDTLVHAVDPQRLAQGVQNHCPPLALRRSRMVERVAAQSEIQFGPLGDRHNCLSFTPPT